MTNIEQTLAQATPENRKTLAHGLRMLAAEDLYAALIALVAVVETLDSSSYMDVGSGGFAMRIARAAIAKAECR